MDNVRNMMFALLLAPLLAAEACQCVADDDPGPDEFHFIGIPLSSTYIKGERPVISYRFKIIGGSEVSVGSFVEIVTSTSNCGYTFEIESTYEVFAFSSGGEEPRWFTGLCNGNKIIKAEDKPDREQTERFEQTEEADRAQT